jgi:hypothetical protein
MGKESPRRDPTYVRYVRTCAVYSCALCTVVLCAQLCVVYSCALCTVVCCAQLCVVHREDLLPGRLVRNPPPGPLVNIALWVGVAALCRVVGVHR